MLPSLRKLRKGSSRQKKIKKCVKKKDCTEDEIKEVLTEAKKCGFSDAQIEKISGGKYNEAEVRIIRKKYGITPNVKQIDTLAAEFPAETNYLYLTYHGSAHDL